MFINTTETRRYLTYVSTYSWTCAELGSYYYFLKRHNKTADWSLNTHREQKLCKLQNNHNLNRWMKSGLLLTQSNKDTSCSDEEIHSRVSSMTYKNKSQLKGHITGQATASVSRVMPSSFLPLRQTLCGPNPTNPQGKQQALASCSDPLADSAA